MTFSGNGVSSIGISQHPFLDNRYSFFIEKCHSQRKIFFNIILVAAAIFATLGYLFATLFVLGAGAATAGVFFVIRKVSIGNHSPPSLQKTEAEYKTAMEKLVKGTPYSVCSFPGNLCEDLSRKEGFCSKKERVFINLCWECLLIKTVKEKFLLAPAPHRFKGLKLKAIDLGNKDSFWGEIQSLLQSNGIMDENQQKNIIGSLYRGLASDFLEKLCNLFINDDLNIGFLEYNPPKKTAWGARLCLDLTTQGVARITFKWQLSLAKMKDTRTRAAEVLAVFDATVTISDHKNGESSYTFLITEP